MANFITNTLELRFSVGVELEDEGEFGTLHFGIGITLGSTIRAVGYVDLVARHPIVEVDGKVVLKDRYVLV